MISNFFSGNECGVLRLLQDKITGAVSCLTQETKPNLTKVIAITYGSSRFRKILVERVSGFLILKDLVKSYP